jgi:hypothetical protein
MGFNSGRSGPAVSRASRSKVFKSHRIQDAYEEQLRVVKAAETALAQRLKGPAGRLLHILFIAGIIALGILAILSVLDLILLEQILELFLPSGTEPVITPFGALQPIACAFSVVMVGVMGIAAITVFETRDSRGRRKISAEEPAFSPDEENSSSVQDSSRDGSILALRLIGGFVFTAGIIFCAWGGFLRAEVGGDPGISPVFANQSPWVNALLSGLCALAEAVTSVLVFKGILEPRGSLLWNRLKLRIITLFHPRVLTLPFIHGTIAVSNDKAEAIAREAAVIEDKARHISAEATKLGQHSTPTSNSGELLALKEKQKAALIDLMEDVHDRIAVLKAEMLQISASPSGNEIPLEKALEQVKKKITDTQVFLNNRMRTALLTYSNQASAIVSLSKPHDSEALARVSAAEEELASLLVKCEAFVDMRARILRELSEMLASEDFAGYSSRSKDASLAKISDIVLLFDGASAVVGKDVEKDLPTRVSSASTMVHQHATMEPPADSGIGKACGAVKNASVNSIPAARNRVDMLHSTEVLKVQSEIQSASEDVVSTLRTFEKEVKEQLACLKAEESEILAKIREQRKANGFFARMVRFLKSIGSNANAASSQELETQGQSTEDPLMSIQSDGQSLNCKTNA